MPFSWKSFSGQSLPGGLCTSSHVAPQSVHSLLPSGERGLTTALEHGPAQQDWTPYLWAPEKDLGGHPPGLAHGKLSPAMEIPKGS